MKKCSRNLCLIGLDPPAGRMEETRMTYSAITGEPIFSPRELLDFSLRAAELSNISAKEIFDDLCYLLGPHYWGYAYDFDAAMREVDPA